MPSDHAAAVSAFVEGAPPGELADVIADVKKLTVNEPNLLHSITPAFQKYNEEQLTSVKLPGSSKNVLVSAYNSSEDGRYFDVESQRSFAFDHQTQKASDVQPYTLQSEHSDLISSLLRSLSTHASEHYPSATYTVCPTPSSSPTLALLLVSNKYSPSNFSNGRYRSTYLLNPSRSPPSLTGTIKLDVHYYEDGNVRLTTSKQIPEITLAASPALNPAAMAAEVLSAIAKVERAYQEELEMGFGRLSEGEFKGLRRQLPVTRQKVEWEKIGGYRLGQDIGGGRSR
ncbi:MAG: hypothetical protein L6R40_001411 [Gallowayella cf. fulva]|nr:MAG: hypothetical protein L6R40_001411 [Xanthomendoza cf. fulva]